MLNPSVLQQGFRRIVDNSPGTRAEAANRFAEVYAQYAAGAMAGGFPALLTGLERAAMAQGLRPGFIVPVGVPAVLAAAFAQGIQTFWALPPVHFGLGMVVVPWVGYAPALAGLTAFFAVPDRPVEVFVSGLSTLVDTLTRSVLVLIPPSTVPVPLT